MTTPTPTIHWAPSPLSGRGSVAVATGVSDAHTLDWGDGTDSIATDRPIAHGYPAPGAYTITAWREGTKLAWATVYIRDGLAPTVTFTPGEDNPAFIDVIFGDEPVEMVSRYRIDWGDDSPPIELPAVKGDTISHGYRPGTHTITVTDLNTRRSLDHEIEIKEAEYDPDFTIGRKPGGDTMTAQLAITKLAAVKEIIIDWGDYHQDKITTPAVGTTADHTYAAADTYIVQLVYSDGSTDGSARTVTVPFPAAGE